ncbi:MAG: lipopolysaccharide heptosyltransferase II [Sulfurimonas sp.]|nr:lipopolysaccharide heptosyltransferase II [Sulfurimonas sp.]
MSFKILVILPNWLGDAIMATPAIELLSRYYQDVEFTFVGSFASIQALKYHPRCKKAVIDTTKESGNRYINTYKLAHNLGEFNLAITFRNQAYSSLLLRFTSTVICIAKESWHSRFLLSHTPKIKTSQHLVKQYSQLAMTDIDNFDGNIPDLKLYIEPIVFKKPTLGINAGATYGSAKRWYPDRFAQVAKEFSSLYDIIIFGGPNEIEMASEIESNLKNLNVSNYINLAGKTDIKELCANIGGCSLFITNDSGPMHIAASYKVPTVSIFGPTRCDETSQWSNEKSAIVKHNIGCSPCMRRECPLDHHECMKGVTASEVIEAVKELKCELKP